MRAAPLTRRLASRRETRARWSSRVMSLPKRRRTARSLERSRSASRHTWATSARAASRSPVASFAPASASRPASVRGLAAEKATSRSASLGLRATMARSSRVRMEIWPGQFGTSPISATSRAGDTPGAASAMRQPSTRRSSASAGRASCAASASAVRLFLRAARPRRNVALERAVAGEAGTTACCVSAYSAPLARPFVSPSARSSAGLKSGRGVGTFHPARAGRAVVAAMAQARAPTRAPTKARAGGDTRMAAIRAGTVRGDGRHSGMELVKRTLRTLHRGMSTGAKASRAPSFRLPRPVHAPMIAHRFVTAPGPGERPAPQT